METTQGARDVQKRYGRRALVVAVGAGFLCILAGEKSFGKGLILGTLFSVVNFVLMGEMLPGRTAPGRYKRFILAAGGIGFRYVLMAVPLIIAVKLNTIHFFGVALGLFMVQLMIVGDHFKRHLFGSGGNGNT